MRRIIKSKDSRILKENIKYKVKGDNSLLREILIEEQMNFCAFTDERFSATNEINIDHFNHNLKGQQSDSYYNWYAITSLYNKLKSTKWYDRILPLDHPDLENRIIYNDCDYEPLSPSDCEAENLLCLTGIRNSVLIKERKNYLRTLRGLEASGINLEDFFKSFSHEIRFPRMIYEEFGLKYY